MQIRELINLTPKEFVTTLKNTTGKSLQYRNNWLKKKVEELGLRVKFIKKKGRPYIKIHKSHLTGRFLHNPYFTDDTLIKFGGYILGVNGDENITLKDVVNNKGWVIYRSSVFIKGFIFYLIKQYYDRNTK